MRIAQIAPLYEAVPPRLYGGTERVVAHLCDELVARGHDVTLFASGDSRTDAKLIPQRDIAIRLDEDRSWDFAAHMAMLVEVRDRADEFDVLHFHLDCMHMPLFADMAQRTLTTLHGRLDIKDLHRFFLHFPTAPVVSISDSQRKPLPFLNWQATVHHGYPAQQYRFSSLPKGGYLAFLGRISPEKGPDKAIEIAKLAGLPLRIAAKVDVNDRAYFKSQIEPLLSQPQVEFIGEIDEMQKSRFLGDALALLVPIDWPEPFGLVIVEAMACGTPVIAFNRGSVSELIEHGRTGFIVDDVPSAAAAVAKLSEIDRRAVRSAFERRFVVEVMANKYETVYKHLLHGKPVLSEEPKRARDGGLTAGRAA